MDALAPKAHALRPVRSMPNVNGFRFYTATTFPEGAWQGCELYLRRANAFGYLRDEPHSPFTLDVLNSDGDVIQDYPLTRAGFGYLRRILHFTVDATTPEVR